MARLVVRKIDPEIVEALRRRAAANGRSVEAEHREILLAALIPPPPPPKPRKSFIEHLLEMPPVGKDADFRRRSDRMRRVKL